MTLEKRFRALYSNIEGARERKGFEMTYDRPPEERQNVTPINAWHNRILSELDLCLQMKAHAGTDVDAAVDGALTVLEQAIAAEGVGPPMPPAKRRSSACCRWLRRPKAIPF